MKRCELMLLLGGTITAYKGRANSLRADASAPHSIASAMSSSSAAHKRSWILSSGFTGRSRSSRQRFASSRYLFGVFMAPLTFVYTPSLREAVGAWIYYCPERLPKLLVPEELVMDPTPAPFGGLLDPSATPVLPKRTSAVC